jgi:hypothetical protein
VAHHLCDLSIMNVISDPSAHDTFTGYIYNGGVFKVTTHSSFFATCPQPSQLIHHTVSLLNTLEDYKNNIDGRLLQSICGT